MKYEIKNRWNDSLIFAVETSSWKLAIEAAVNAKADFSGTNLRRSDLSWADLHEAKNLNVGAKV